MCVCVLRVVDVCGCVCGWVRGWVCVCVIVRLCVSSRWLWMRCCEMDVGFVVCGVRVRGWVVSEDALCGVCKCVVRASWNSVISLRPAAAAFVST
mmetsp:Transcript_5780/g.8570  ORF Transcript_5780/g.8570 Transcript_5780/m.8570 type:complete len:95 (-) Transcript_5780:356-640(-)